MDQNQPDGPAWPRRLDHAVAAVAGVSRRHAQRLIAAEQVRVNGRPARVGDKGSLVAGSDRVTVADRFDRVTPEPDAPLHVLAGGEGHGWVAVDKPAGQPVHPLQPGETGTLLNAVAARYPRVQGVGDEGGLRAGVVHRLDIETSGVVLFALDHPDWQRFRNAFAAHLTVKKYLALVQGSPPPDGRVDLNLAVTRHRPARVEVVPADRPDARRCTMSFRVNERLREAALVEVRLDTGFLHQVRVSLAHLGHPLLGDARYGKPSTDMTPCRRTMLHAASLTLDEVHAEAPAPPDFADALRSLQTNTA